MDWYFIKEGEQVGPVDEKEIFRLARAGVILRRSRVWNATLGGEWGYAADVSGLFPPEPLLNHTSHLPQTPANGNFRHPTPFPASDDASAKISITPNIDLMLEAQASLQGHWWLAVGAGLVAILLPVLVGAVPVAGLLAVYAVAPPIQLGWTGFTLCAARQGSSLGIGLVFDGFRNYWKSIGLFLLTNLYIFLWSLLLIVPGILAAYSYAMAFYVLCDNPEIGVNEALKRSKIMMRGNRWKFFCLSCRFIGWAILSILTCGIGYFFLVPYMQVAFAHFYEDIR